MGRNIWCVSILKNKTGHEVVQVFPIITGENIAAGRFDGYEIVCPCETKKFAYQLAEFWIKQEETKEEQAEQVEQSTAN